jgi:hypothetical protein
LIGVAVDAFFSKPASTFPAAFLNTRSITTTQFPEIFLILFCYNRYAIIPRERVATGLWEKAKKPLTCWLYMLYHGDEALFPDAPLPFTLSSLSIHPTGYRINICNPRDRSLP